MRYLDGCPCTSTNGNSEKEKEDISVAKWTSLFLMLPLEVVISPATRSQQKPPVSCESSRFRLSRRLRLCLNFV